MTSPLGKYAQAVAALLAIFCVVSWVVSEYLSGLGIMQGPPPGLKEVALIAVGAVFGAQAAVNGVKPAIDAAHTRLDKIGVPSAQTIRASESAAIAAETIAAENPPILR
jgi:hypothetical protein